MRAAVGSRIRVAVEAGSKRLFGVAGYGGGDKNAITPYHWGGNRKPGNFRHPGDVGSLGGIPLDGRVGTVAESGAGWAAELRPVSVSGGTGKGQTKGWRQQLIFHFHTPFLK